MHTRTVLLAGTAVVVLAFGRVLRTAMQLRNERDTLRDYVDMLVAMRPCDQDAPGYNDTRRFGGTTIQVFGPIGESPFALKSEGEGSTIEVVRWPSSFTVQRICDALVDTGVVVRGERGTDRILLDYRGDEQQAMTLVARVLAAAISDR